jgi:hypothetical protein
MADRLLQYLGREKNWQKLSLSGVVQMKCSVGVIHAKNEKSGVTNWNSHYK